MLTDGSMNAGHSMSAGHSMNAGYWAITKIFPNAKWFNMSIRQSNICMLPVCLTWPTRSEIRFVNVCTLHGKTAHDTKIDKSITMA